MPNMVLKTGFVEMASGYDWRNGEDRRSHLVFRSDRIARCGYEMRRGANERGLDLCTRCADLASAGDFLERHDCPGDGPRYQYSYPTMMFHHPGCGRVRGASYRNYTIDAQRAFFIELVRHGSIHRMYANPMPGSWCDCDEQVREIEEAVWKHIGGGVTGETPWEERSAYSCYYERSKTVTFRRRLDPTELELFERYVKLKGWGWVSPDVGEGKYRMTYSVDSSG